MNPTSKPNYWLWVREGEFRKHPGDLPRSHRIGKTGPKHRAEPCGPTSGKRRRTWA